MDAQDFEIPQIKGSFVDIVMAIMFRLAGLCMLGLMGLVFASVIFRYFLNDPIIGVEDWMGMLLGLTIFMAFPFVTRGRGHIQVDLLVPLFKRSRWLNNLRLFLIDFGTVAMLVFLGLRLYDQAVKHFSRGSVTQAAELPLWPFAAVFVALVALSILAFALVAVESWRDRTSGKDQAS
ncbi:MAG: TRAP transporter small permease [Pseudomonadota bacterium]